MLSWMFDSDNAAAILITGFITNGISFFIIKQSKTKNSFLQQLALVFNLCGQLIVAWGIYESLDSIKADFFFTLMAYQIVLLFIINDFTSRVLTTWFSMVALYIALAQLGILYISVAIVSLLFFAVWLNDEHWKQYRKFLEPVGYGLAIAVLQFNGHLLFNGGVDDWFSLNILEWFVEYSFWISESVVIVILASLLFKLIKQYEIGVFSLTGGILIASALFILFIDYYMVGISTSFLLIVIGFLKRRIVLMGLGLFSLLVFISGYYYYLEETLLIKSGMLIGLGGCFLMGYFVLLKLTPINSSRVINKSVNILESKTNKGQWITIVSLIFILLVVNFNILKKEQLLESGDIVLLELVPVDPRSLMQGDYMRLRFSIEQTLLNEESDLQNSEKYFIIERDENKVGHFSHVDQGLSLTETQFKMLFRVRDNKIRLATHAFFFQEGTAKEYEKARYGEFRVANDGELLLNNLRDESFNVIGFNRPNN